MLKQGIRWRIGNDTHINVWTVPWLRDDRNFWVQTTQSAELEGLRVGDLMILGTLEWDVDMLEELFVARDVAEIKCIPLSQFFDAYRHIWHFTNSREYTIKTGYHALTQLLGVHSQLSQDGEWRKNMGPEGSSLDDNLFIETVPRCSSYKVTTRVKRYRCCCLLSFL